jgi:hypothetical protein
LYQINERTVMGEITNGWPLLAVDRSTLLCSQSLAPQRSVAAIWQQLVGLLSSRPRVSGSDPQRYFLLNLEKDTALEMGVLPQHPSSIVQPSPDLRFAYVFSIGGGPAPQVQCFDFKRGEIRELYIKGWPAGWWDQTNLLVTTTNNDFVLYDVTTRKMTPLISSSNLATFLKEHDITEDPTKARPFFQWNGQENEFYLTDTYKKWSADESYLIKVERSDARLTLLSTKFKFEWSDQFDQTGRYYAYSGRDSGKASDGVFVRDLQTGTSQIAVAPTKNTSFSIPRFYGDWIIYSRSNRLWKINVDGTENQLLFPPSPSQATE